MVVSNNQTVYVAGGAIVRGVIRPDDINPSNQIYSYSIANAQIRYEGKGQIARRQKPGLLNKLFDWIF